MAAQNRPLIQFSHANGFPGSTYQQLYSSLSKDYDIDYIDIYADEGDPYKVTNNWSELVNQLVHRIEQHNRPVIAVGHSLGGVLSLLSMSRRPDLVQSVVMLDAPYFSAPKRFLIGLVKILGHTKVLTPGGKSVLARRVVWDSMDDVVSYLKTKKLFSNFTEQSLADWAEFATYDDGDGRRKLKISPEVEYSIYGTLPHKGVEMSLIRKSNVHAVIGNNSNVIGKLDVMVMQYIYGIKIHNIKGGHMFPFEYPEDTAEVVNRIIKHKNEANC